MYVCMYICIKTLTPNRTATTSKHKSSPSNCESRNISSNLLIPSQESPTMNAANCLSA